ncbi:hypothetical protein J4E91_009816 [Alternaria rosae]|nr:hypothetical protein J4E91_009816 [Alternaria rosae]
MKQKTLEWAGYPANWCTACMGGWPETHEDLPFGFLTLPSEPAMNAAGRTSDHQFKDLRSARRVRQRSKTYPERIYSGNKRRRNDRYRLARENQLRHESKRIDIQEWEDDCYDKRAHKVNMEHMDDIEAYELFGKNAHIFEGTAEGEIITGEDFGTWARRRIAEMQRVKERRIHTYGKPASPTPLSILPHTMRDDRRSGRVSATIPTAPFAKPHETTLPTTLSEIRAHATLTCLLTLPKILKQRCRSRNEPALPSIRGFWWWGDLVEWVRGELRGRMEEDEAVLRMQRERIGEEKLDEDDQGWDDLSDWGRYLEDEYVILGEDQDGSETWSIVSGVDKYPFDDHDIERVGRTV